EDVPWQLALLLAEKIRSPDVEVLLVKNGDHRLSEPADLQRLRSTVERLLGCAAPASTGGSGAG
ncbi:MAG: hypothetical protein ACRCVD_07775, partial [Halioglobus sp.]